MKLLVFAHRIAHEVKTMVGEYAHPTLLLFRRVSREWVMIQVSGNSPRKRGG